MPENLKARLISLLRWSEKYTKTDMVYLAQSNFWLQATSVFVSLGSLLLYIIFGHVLPKDVYGTYQYLLSVGALVSAFTLTGMSTAVTRAVARGFEGAFLESISVQLRWGLIPLTGSVIVGAYYLVHGNVTLGWGMILIGVFIPLNTTFNTYASFLAAKKDFRRSFYYSILVNAPYYIAVALVAFSVQAALALLAANLIVQCIGYITAHFRTLVVYKPGTEIESDTMALGKHYSAINFLTAAAAQIDNLLVFHFLGAAPLAIYSFATAIPDRLNIFKNLTVAALPRFTQRDYADIRSTMSNKIILSVGFSLLVIALWFVSANFLFSALFPKYISAVPYSQVYVLTVMGAFGSFFTTYFVAHNHLRTLYAYNLIAPVIQVGFLLVGIVFGGLWGLVLARVASGFFNSLLAGAFFYLLR